MARKLIHISINQIMFDINEEMDVHLKNKIDNKYV